MTRKNKQSLFLSLVYVVGAFALAYSVIFGIMDAKFTSVALLVSGTIVTSLTVFLNRRGHDTAARSVFIFGSLFYVFIAPYGLGTSVGEDLFYIPAVMLPLLLFDPHQKKAIWLGMMMPVAAWAMNHWGPSFNLNPAWAPEHVQKDALVLINYIGALLLTLIFVNIYSRHMRELKEIAVRELAHSRLVEERLEEAQALSHMGSWSFDVESGAFNWSKQMFELFSREVKKGEPTYDEFTAHIHPEDCMHYELEVGKCLATGQDFSVRVRLGDKETFRWVEFKGKARFNTDSEVTFMFGTCRDITSEKEADQKILNTSKMSALGEISAGLAHEINNPLAIINAKAALARRRLDRGEMDVEKTKADLEVIETTTARIAHTIKGLRSFSHNSTTDPMALVKVSRVIEETLELCRTRFRNHNIELRLKNTSDATIECRQSQIEQVLMNVLSNAHDAVLNLKEKWVEVSVEASEDWVNISVTDSGNGIPVDVAERMMLPFITTKAPGKGTGLGLSISKGIAEEHQGHVRYDPTSPKTKFVIDLPTRQLRAA